MQVAQRLYEGVESAARRRPHHLHAYRRRADGARGDRRRRATRSPSEFGDRYLPEKPRYLYDQGEERPGSARSDPPDRFLPHARQRAPYLDDDQARLYELIWKRAIASQMATAEIERTTVEHRRARNGAARAGLRATGRSSRFDGFLAVYTDSREEGRRAEDEEGGRLPEIRAGEDARPSEKIDADAAFHRAAAALFRSDAGQADGRARHRPAVDLCLDPRDAAGPRLCAASTSAADPAGQGPAGHGVPREASSTRYVEYDFTADPRRKARPDFGGRTCTGRTCCAISGRSSSASVEEIKELRVTDVLDALERVPGAAASSRRARMAPIRASARPAARASCR